MARSVLHVVGARPNFMKVAPVHRALAAAVAQTVVHTGQHYDRQMSQIFFDQLGLPAPDVNLEVGSSTHAVQTGQIMIALEPILLERRPDLVLVYGDVNSTVAAALVCSKLLVPVGHVEAGLRSGDRTMPEEINRIVTDQLSNLLFTPSADGDANLAGEGVAAERVHRVGNVMIDTLVRLLPAADASAVRSQWDLRRDYVLVTLHRPSNVDDASTLVPILDALHEIAQNVDVVFPVHPRTRARLGERARGADSRLRLIEPLGYLEFLALQREAAAVITDSGGIQEETSFLGTPCITVRENTERPITVSHGTNVLVGRDMALLREAVAAALRQRDRRPKTIPLWDGRAGERIARIVLQH